ncbi:MAG: hypothetical protein ACK5JF_03190 [Oscillospiraceae bacterium]
MKKILLVALLAALVILAGCGAGAVSSLVKSGSESSSVSAASSGASSLAGDGSNALDGERAIGGAIEDATMNTITIKTIAGGTYSFTKENASVEVENGLLIGENVTIYYTGTLQDAQNQTAEAVRITDEATLTGKITDATMNTITIGIEGDKVFSFGTEDASVEAADGLLIGETVTIYYTGDLDAETEVQTVTVVRIIEQQ